MVSPFLGDSRADMRTHVAYGRRCLLDCLMRGESPIASHLTHTQVLDDMKRIQRTNRLEAGLAWVSQAEAVVLYTDHGVDEEMQRFVEKAGWNDIPVERRSLEGRERA